MTSLALVTSSLTSSEPSLSLYSTSTLSGLSPNSKTSLSTSTTSSKTSERLFLAKFELKIFPPKFEFDSGDESALGVGSSKGEEEEERFDRWSGVSLDRWSYDGDSLDRLLVEGSKDERLFLEWLREELAGL